MTTQTVPVFGLSYGPSSYGKTADAGLAFPTALFFVRKGGLKSITALGGFMPHSVEVSDLDDAAKVLRENQGKYPAFVFDEFDFLVEDTFRKYERRFSGYKLFGELKRAVLNFRNDVRETPGHVWLTALEKGPKLKDDGTKIRGGPALTGDLPEKLPAMCDLVLRASRDPMRRPWAGIYRLDVNSSDWVGKDRDNGTPDPAPMNVGEILRFNGYDLPRLPSLPWQEGVVAGIHAKLIDVEEEQEPEIAQEWYAKLIGQGIGPQAARWTVRDALDRTLLHRAAAIRNANYY